MYNKWINLIIRLALIAVASLIVHISTWPLLHSLTGLITFSVLSLSTWIFKYYPDSRSTGAAIYLMVDFSLCWLALSMATALIDGNPRLEHNSIDFFYFLEIIAIIMIIAVTTLVTTEHYIETD